MQTSNPLSVFTMSGATAVRLRLLRVIVLSAAALAAATAIAPALTAADLESEYVLEARLLESELERYLETRERETQAVQEVRRISGQLDEVLASPNSSVAEMRQLEAMFTAARETAYLRLKETAAVRERMYERMERLAEIARGMERREPEPLRDAERSPDGLWEFRFQGIEIYALVDLTFEASGLDRGWTALGTYRNSNGHRGTLRGLFRESRLELEAMDSRRGKVATLDGTIEPGGRLRGTWTAVRVDLDAEGPQAGTWTAHRVSSESDVSLD
jgi:hypothetical protein